MTSNSLKEKVRKLLWSGEAVQAEELLSSAESDVDKEIIRLQADLNSKRKEKAEIMELSVGRDGYEANASQSVREKEKRHKKVIVLAKRLANNDGVVQTKDITTEIVKAGIDLGVPPSREATTISSILKSAGFTKKDKGVYRVPED